MSDNSVLMYEYGYCPSSTLCYKTESVLRTPYIPPDKLYIIEEPIRKITITLFIINFVNNVF